MCRMSRGVRRTVLAVLETHCEGKREVQGGAKPFVQSLFFCMEQEF